MKQSDFTPGDDFVWIWPEFSGAKLVLLRDGHILTYLRDHGEHLPFPDHWDLPGGGREGGEAPIACALRELHEEFGLRLGRDRLRGHVFPSLSQPGLQSWLFAGHLTAAEIASIRFGDEGQEWRLMPLNEYLDHPRAVPHFKSWVRVALDGLAPPS